ncbi:MAG: DUF5686 and carboxypeptidase regulatory-like domain-containing protein [Muribaculaceae bacterium]|nr:DUF5686 and carboxypeptidase regulatory-like domain-containing protein [Muribaculaceae bacterium]
MPRTLISLLFVLVLCHLSGAAAEGLVRGIVRDSVTTQGLPYASVTANPSGVASVADSKGIFEFRLPAGTESITARCQGYATRTVPAASSTLGLYDIYLQPQAQELKEVVIKRKRYSKKNNPAVDFATRIRNARELTDPRRNDWYSYDRYERIALALNDFDTTQANNWMRSMPFLIEHVDTSEISGRPVLNVSLKERATTEYWQREGSRSQSVTRGVKSSGVDEFMDQDNVQTVLNDLLREIDLYDKDIHLLRNTFVSPLSPVAPDFYRFYLVDSAAVVPGSAEPHIALAFYPRNKSYFGFSGHVYVPLADTTMFIRRVEMHAPKEINLNFIKDLSITQTFDRAADGSRLKTTDDMMMVLSVLPKTSELYVTRKISTRNHSFSRPAGADSIFTAGGTSTLPDASQRDSLFWVAEASAPVPEGESRLDELMRRLRRKPLFYWGEKALGIIVNGYVPTGKKSRFDFGPVNTIASYNDLEGLRLRAGGMTTANLSPHFFARGYVAHGFRDHRWKYALDLEYSFKPKKYHPREFPVHSLRLIHRYDVDRLGSHYLYTSPDNFVLSLERKHDNRFTYLRETSLCYTLELPFNFSIEASAAHMQQCASPYVRFITATGRELGHYGSTVFALSLRYAPGETFYQAKSSRVSINEDAPVFAITHRYAPGGVFGTRYGFNRTELSVSKQFRLSMAGALELNVSGGHVWGSAPFTELFIPNANLSYIIQPRSFALMNPMEFINSSFVSWHATWKLKGALLNLVPGVRRLGLREVVSFCGLWGHRSGKVEPDAANGLPLFPTDITLTDMSGRPYMEISAGLDNILRLFRVDYVWRLSYRHVPYPIDRHGVRIAMHFTF